MRRTVFAVLLAAGAAAAEPSGSWRFEGGELGGRAGAFEKGAAPEASAEVPHAAVWDGNAGFAACATNGGSLRFRAPETAGAGAPVGGEVAVPDAPALTRPASFTAEAFVRVARLTGRHALLASKRRGGQTGATWSLSVTPAGTLGVRFDTQPDGVNGGPGFNQCLGAAGGLDDGRWHHVALTYDAATQAAGLYVDYERRGGGTTPNPLAYDASDLVLGRGLDGWLDEVRLTPEALHPEQFLRGARFFSDLKPKAAPLPPMLDPTFTRVQSALDPGLARLGTLIPKRVREIETPMWSLGCETLDRDLASWDVYKGYLEPLGIRRIRLQGGWNRTERQKGVYDFAWLDAIVDDAHARGLQVCLETSYNCRLYEPTGATGPGGLLPAGEETLAAWDRWVEAMARRYSAKGVKEWMMYNEPNLRKENTAELIVANNVRTAEIIKRVDPEAKIGAFVLAGLNVDMLKTMLEQLKAQGKLGLFHWAIYHGYSGNPDRLNACMAEFNALLAEVAPSIKPWQGEAGCASEEVQFALSGIPWTEYSHAKWNARRMLCDLGCGVESSVFTISDLAYHKDFISRYGLLKTSPDNAVIRVKTAYYTVQNVVSLFNGALERVPDYVLTLTAGATNLTWFAFRDKASGLDAVALWDGTEIPGNGSDLKRVDLAIRGGRFKEPVWVDLITGNVFEIPADQMATDGDAVTFAGVPVYDGPGTLTDRSLLAYEKAREKKGAKAKPKPTPAAAKAAGPAPELTPCLLPGTQQPAPAVLIAGLPAEEAARVAKWLNAQEVHALVLPAAAAAGDVRRAVQAVRARAAEWQVKPDAVGVLAGGASARLALAALGAADFAVLLGADTVAVPEAARAKVAVYPRDGWEQPLAAWLEARKGKVF